LNFKIKTLLMINSIKEKMTDNLLMKINQKIQEEHDQEYKNTTEEHVLDRLDKQGPRYVYEYEIEKIKFFKNKFKF